jgi:hypothetical protein
MAHEPILDEVAHLFQVASQLGSSSTPTVRDVMDLRNRLLDARSRLLDVNENHRENLRSVADIDQLIDSIDQMIKQSLSPEGKEAWLKATAISKDLKETYENPSSIFYHAVRTDNPSTLTDEFADWLMASPTPERVRELRARVGDEGVRVVARAVSEKLLGRTAAGEYDFREFPDRLENLNEDFRNELFGQGHQRVRDIAIASRVLTTDNGRSRSSKIMQKRVEIIITFGALIAAVWEAWAGHPWAAGLTIAVPLLYHSAQYGLARLLTSPRFTEWLMTSKPKK